MIYMFDMDGTLTPARKPMEEDFAKCFLPWLQKNKAFIVTGSDIAKVFGTASVGCRQCFFGNILRHGQ